MKDKIYEQIEQIKSLATAMGFMIGEVKMLDDFPHVKITIELLKNLSSEVKDGKS